MKNFFTLNKTIIAIILAVTGTMANTMTVVHAEQSIIVQSTTSTANSGLYDYLLPLFKRETGIVVNVVAVGTGQAIKNASNCDGDVLLVHAKSAEERFVAQGFGVKRTNLMYNDFIIVGPEDDPADISGNTSVAPALKTIALTRSLFASRGDNSGTHKKEMQLWQSVGIDPVESSGQWYRETGSGMGTTLNVGVGMNAYVLTDRATWIRFKNKTGFKIIVEGDPNLFNQYGIILVNPKHCPNINAVAGQQFVDWLTSTTGQSAIGNYRYNNRQLFYPNAP